MKFLLVLIVGIFGANYCAGYHDQDHLNIGIASKKKTPCEATEDKVYWFNDGQSELKAQIKIQPKIKKVKNIIYFLADGTSISTFTAARILKGSRSGLYEREKTSWEALPFTGIIKTYNTDNIVTDSAASATAYLTGVKGNQATIGVDINVNYGVCKDMNIEEYHTQSILRDFQFDNRSTGIVTTTRITHASPAGNYAHTANRHWENDSDVNDDGADSEVCDDIAEQFVLSDTGTRINVALGGGRRGFLPKEIIDEDGVAGRRNDGKNLKDIWLTSHNKDGHTGVYVGHRDDLLAVNTSATDYLLGLFSSSHLKYKVDSVAGGSEPTLEEMTQRAIEVLRKNKNGFFLFVEGGLIDLAHHLNEANSALEEAIEFEKAIVKATEMTSPEDTLIIVTADHGHTNVINGYPARHDYILGLTGPSDADNMLYNILMYTNGPGFRDQVNHKRPDSKDENYADPHFVYPSTVPIHSANHNGEDVPIYASGPFAHLFIGVHENSYIPQALRYAACVGEGLHYCDEGLHYYHEANGGLTHLPPLGFRIFVASMFISKLCSFLYTYQIL